MYCVESKVFIENDDLCISCQNYVQDLNCPLLSALAQGDVFLENSLQVQTADFIENLKESCIL